MKKIHVRAGCASFAGRILKYAFTTAALLGMAASLRAQIPVNVGVNPTITFEATPTPPPATEWSTFDTTTGDSGTYSDAASVDAGAQTLNQANITTALGTTGANGTARLARHNTAGTYLVTQPTGVPFAILKATLRNTSGGVITDITVSYDFGVAVTSTTETAPGHEAFYSMTGLPNSWQKIDNFSGLNAAASVSATLANLGWGPGTDMYLLWVDDNGVTNPDGGYTIDNFAITAVGGNLEAITITNQPPAAVTLPERGSTTLSVGASGSPIAYAWFRDGVEIPGANGPNYTIPPAVYPADTGAQFYVVLSNSLSFVTSDTTTLTVTEDLIPPGVFSVVGESDQVTVRVVFNEPLLPGTVSSANFSVFPTGTDPDASPIQIYTGVLDNGTNVILTTDPRTLGESYSLRILDVTDNSAFQNVISPNPTFVTNFAQNVLLIGFDVQNDWKYNINEGSLDGTGWEQPAYDDATWPSGPSGLGLDVSAGTGNGPGLPQQPILTTLPYAANGVVTYFRKHFTLPSATNGVVLTLRDCVEDGAVYYLNGQLVFTNRMPAGPYTFTTLATGAPDPTPTTGPFNLAITNLQQGDNVLAVEVHQSGATSSDIELSVQLEARISKFASGPPIIVGQPQGHTVNEGQPLVLTVAAEGALPLSFQWYKDGVELTGQTNSILSIPSALLSDAGNYTVVVANSINSVTSNEALMNVAPDLTSPVFLLAVAETNLTTILLTFSERLDLASAENVAHYNVHLTAGPGAALTIESAVLTNGTNVILTTSPRTQSQDYTIVLNNVTDTATTPNEATPGTRAVNCAIVILAPDDTHVWKFNQASNNLDNTGWETPAYNDNQAGWQSGPAGLSSFGEEASAGFELRDFNLLAQTNMGPPTIYFRTHFDFPGATNGAVLLAAGVVDDGAVFYVNGVRAGAIRMTNNPAHFTNQASATAPEVTNVFHQAEGPFVLAAHNLVASGDNVLAVEVHQNGTASSDVILSVQLIAEIQTFSAVVSRPTLHISRNEATGQITLRWTESGFMLQEANSLNGNGPGTGWVNSARQNGVPFTPTPGQDVRFYRLSN